MSELNGDIFRLSRFVEAQRNVYDDALGELLAGKKRTHWMWFIFPQVAGLGFSAMAQRYAINSEKEGKAYLRHPVLGLRLHTCADALWHVQDRSVREIMGRPDDLKLHSSMTLFSALAGPGALFERVLEKYYAGSKDARTLSFLAKGNSDMG